MFKHTFKTYTSGLYFVDIIPKIVSLSLMLNIKSKKHSRSCNEINYEIGLDTDIQYLSDSLTSHGRY